MIDNGSTYFKSMDEAWISYSNQCIDEDELSTYTAVDVRDDFYSGACAVFALLKSGLTLEEINDELLEWHDEGLEITI